jgi:predicted XRE-type DNA-binding protein
MKTKIKKTLTHAERRKQLADELRLQTVRLWDSGNGLKKADIARELGVTRERIGQILKAEDERKTTDEMLLRTMPPGQPRQDVH